MVSWLDKETQIGLLTMADMQKQAYDNFLKEYGTQKLALAHTKIFMKAVAMMASATNGGKR